MTKNVHRSGIGSGRKVLFVALLAAFNPAQAADESVAELTNPDAANVSAGIGWASGNSNDRALFGQYNGLRTPDAHLLLDFLYNKREDSGLWMTSVGRNIGLDVLDVGLIGGKQGDWKAGIDYRQFDWRDPRSINSGVQNFGGTNPVIGNSLAAPGTGGNFDLSLKRKDVSLGVSKWILPNLSFDATYKYEDKSGARLWGIGGYCSNAMSPSCKGAVNGTVGALYLTPEPISSTTQQFEAKLNYNGEGYGLTLGYYGGFYSNGNSVMTPSFANGAKTTTNTGDQLGSLAAYLSQPVALPPDNQANQFYLSGFAALPLNTKVNVKATYTHATQNESYPSQLLVGAYPNINGNLGGTIDTTVIQANLTSRPLPQLTINGSIRWEDRQDDTSLGNYVIAPNGGVWTNWANSSNLGNAKLEAGYQFGDLGRATIGGDYAYVNRDRPQSSTWIPQDSMAAMRESNNEAGVYVDLRRSMSDTFNAAVTYRYAKREGYHWYSLDNSAGFPYVRYDSFSQSSGTFPMTMLNRTRNSIKVTADWTPTDVFSMNFQLEDGKDSYDGPNGVSAGLQDTKVQFYNVDAVLKLSADWKANAYASWGKQNLNMQQGIGYIAGLQQENTAIGLGINGPINAAINVGGDLSYLYDKNSYNLSMTTGALVPNLPDSSYKATILKLWGQYAIDKKSDLRLDLIQQWATYEDWTWGYNGVPFTYSDNSTVSMQPTQNVTFVGLRYIYRFK